MKVRVRHVLLVLGLVVLAWVPSDVAPVAGSGHPTHGAPVERPPESTVVAIEIRDLDPAVSRIVIHVYGRRHDAPRTDPRGAGVDRGPSRSFARQSGQAH